MSSTKNVYELLSSYYLRYKYLPHTGNSAESLPEIEMSLYTSCGCMSNLNESRGQLVKLPEGGYQVDNLVAVIRV